MGRNDQSDAGRKGAPSVGKKDKSTVLPQYPNTGQWKTADQDPNADT